MLVLVRKGVLAGARPLLVLSRGRDRGKVMRLSSVVRLRQEEGVVADPGLSVWLGSLGLARPWSFRILLTNVL